VHHTSRHRPLYDKTPVALVFGGERRGGGGGGGGKKRERKKERKKKKKEKNSTPTSDFESARLI